MTSIKSTSIPFFNDDLALTISLTLSVAATTQSATAWIVVDTRRIASVARWRGPYDDAKRRPRAPWPRRSPTSRARSLFPPSTVLPAAILPHWIPHVFRQHFIPTVPTRHHHMCTNEHSRLHTYVNTQAHTNTRTQMQERGNDSFDPLEDSSADYKE